MPFIHTKGPGSFLLTGTIETEHSCVALHNLMRQRCGVVDTWWQNLFYAEQSSLFPLLASYRFGI